jgi:hypothetical protein
LTELNENVKKLISMVEGLRNDTIELRRDMNHVKSCIPPPHHNVSLDESNESSGHMGGKLESYTQGSSSSFSPCRPSSFISPVNEKTMWSEVGGKRGNRFKTRFAVVTAVIVSIIHSIELSLRHQNHAIMYDVRTSDSRSRFEKVVADIHKVKEKSIVLPDLSSPLMMTIGESFYCLARKQDRLEVLVLPP